MVLLPCICYSSYLVYNFEHSLCNRCCLGTEGEQELRSSRFVRKEDTSDTLMRQIAISQSQKQASFVMRQNQPSPSSFFPFNYAPELGFLFRVCFSFILTCVMQSISKHGSPCHIHIVLCHVQSCAYAGLEISAFSVFIFLSNVFAMNTSSLRTQKFYNKKLSNLKNFLNFFGSYYLCIRC